jgi:hypothetical protein
MCTPTSFSCATHKSCLVGVNIFHAKACEACRCRLIPSPHMGLLADLYIAMMMPPKKRRSGVTSSRSSAAAMLLARTASA